MGMKFEYKGVTYSVPCMPKKEWGEWMTSGMRCGLAGVCNNQCYPCKEGCIYGYLNSNARSAFYYECFPEEKSVEKPSCEECANYKPKEELPQLTQEVFERKDCPEWAKWAAVDVDGKGYWYRYRPVLSDGGSPTWVCSPAEDFGGHVLIRQSFDASDWEHSLIEREIKPQYKILEHKDRDNLEGLVSGYLKQGWKLKGAATKSRDKYMQTVVKEN